MQFVLADIWNDWRESYEQRGEGPSSHCERVGDEQWRLTANGITARNDLDAGHASTVFDFVLRRGYFDGQPRLMPDGRISQRSVVSGRGTLARMQRVGNDVNSHGVTITNWEAGGQAFAVALSELLKLKLTVAEPAPTPTTEPPSLTLLRVFTNGVVDERIEKATTVLMDDKLTANEKLSKIDALIRFPPTASAEQLGEMLGVSKQAVLKTDWWKQHRRGEKYDEIGRPRTAHKERSERSESSRMDDER